MISSTTSTAVHRFATSSRRPYLPVQAVSEAPAVVAVSMGPTAAPPVTNTLLPSTELVSELVATATINVGSVRGGSTIVYAGQNVQALPALQETPSPAQGTSIGLPKSALSSTTTLLHAGEATPTTDNDSPNALGTDAGRPALSLLEAVAGIAIAVGQARASGVQNSEPSPQTFSGASGMPLPTTLRAPGTTITPAAQPVKQYGLVFALDGVHMTAFPGHNPAEAVVDGTTLSLAGQPFVVDGHTIEAAINGIIVDATTTSFPIAAATGSVVVPESALITAGGRTFTAISHPASDIDYLTISGNRLAISGDAVHIAGHTFSASDNGVAVDGSTTTLSFSRTAKTQDFSDTLPSSAITTIDGMVYTATLSNDRQTAYFSDTAISIGGAALTLASQTLSLASPGLVVQVARTTHTISFTPATISRPHLGGSSSFATATIAANFQPTISTSTPTTATSPPAESTSRSYTSAPTPASSAIVRTRRSILVLVVTVAIALHSCIG